MWWLALIVVAGCGRIAFDPLGEGGPGDGDGGTSGDGGNGDAAIDAAPVTCSSSFGTVGSTLVNGTTATATANAPGNNMPNTLAVVQVHWASNTGTISAMSDTNGNTYTVGTSTSRSGTMTQVMYFAPYQIGGAGTLTINFTTAVPTIDITIALYRGVDLVNPLAANAVDGQGNSLSPMTTNANVTAQATLVSGLTSNVSSATPGSGFQKRAGVSGSLLQDRCAGTAGTYNATATLSGAGSWILHMIALRSL